MLGDTTPARERARGRERPRTGKMNFRDPPSGKRVWVRARSHAGSRAREFYAFS